MVGNIQYLLFYATEFFQNKLGYGLSLADIALGTGMLAFLITTGLALLKNFFGLGDNLVNIGPMTYSGNDVPRFLSEGKRMSFITLALTFTTMLGAGIGYAFTLWGY